jgi:Caspase domain
MYYSGHGALSSSGQSPCAVGIDGSRTNLQKSFLAAANSACPDGSNAFILLSDACLAPSSRLLTPPCAPYTSHAEMASPASKTRARAAYIHANHACNPAVAVEHCAKNVQDVQKGNLIVCAHAAQPGQHAMQPGRMLYGMWTSCLLEALLIEDARGADVLKVLAQTGRLMSKRGYSQPPYSLFTPGHLSTVNLARSAQPCIETDTCR